MYTGKKWAEPSLVLHKFDEEALLALYQEGLSLRPQIEEVIDEIWERGFDGIWLIGIGGTYFSCMQAHVYAKHRTSLPVYCENAAEFVTTGNKRFTDRAAVIFSSESGTTKEMIEMTRKAHEAGAFVFGFIDTPGSLLTGPEYCDRCIVSRKNEQLKLFMCVNYLAKKNGEFEDCDAYNANMEAYLPEALVQAEKEADDWARRYAQKITEFRKEHPDLPHYFIGAGNQYGAVCSYAMCYWEEQLWIRTRAVSCADFFHGVLEIMDKDTPVTLYIGEDEQRPLAERVARFLPKVCDNYVIIDTKEFALEGILPEYRGTISHHVMHAVNNRIDAYMEYYMRHPMTIRRYYRQFEY